MNPNDLAIMKLDKRVDELELYNETLVQTINRLRALLPALQNTTAGLTQNVLKSMTWDIAGGSNDTVGGQYYILIPHNLDYIPQVIVTYLTSTGRLRAAPSIRTYDHTTVDTNGVNDGSKIIGIWEWIEVEVDETNIKISVQWANPSWYPSNPGNYTVSPLSGSVYITNVPLGTDQLFTSLVSTHVDTPTIAESSP